VDGVKWINNHFEAIGSLKNESPHKKERNISFTIRNVNEHGAGQVRNLLIKDNTFEQFSPGDSLLEGLAAGHRIENVVFENLVIAGRERANASDAGIKISRFVENVDFK